MTTKETDKELQEIFEYKYALTEKINHNTMEIFKIESAIEEEDNMEVVDELKWLASKGKKILQAQVSERQKLSFKKIAQQLGLKNRNYVNYKYSAFVESKIENRH